MEDNFDIRNAIQKYGAENLGLVRGSSFISLDPQLVNHDDATLNRLQVMINEGSYMLYVKVERI